MDNINDFIIEDDVLTEYVGNEANVVIPDGIKVIRSHAFENCTSLVSIVIPNSVTLIDIWAFQSCTSLKDVIISNPDTYVVPNAFENCWELVDSNGLIIVGEAIHGCRKDIPSVVIPDFVSEIGGGCFRDCYNLSEVYIPDSVVEIDMGAFRRCPLLNEVVIPDSVKCVRINSFDSHTKVVVKNIEVFEDSDNKMNAVLGLPRIFGSLSQIEKKRYFSYAKSKTYKLMLMALEDPGLLTIFVDNNYLVPSLFEEYLEEAEKRNNIEAKMILLNAKNKMVTDFNLSNETEDEGIKGKCIAWTGDLTVLRGSKFKAFIEKHGGKAAGSVSSLTDYLVTNDTPSFRGNRILAYDKYCRAKSFGVKILNEEEFFELVGDRP